METTKSFETKEENELTDQLVGVEKELGFLLLGVILGAVLGIVGSLWVEFLVELLQSIIPSESWTIASFIGLLLSTILSIYLLVKVVQTAQKYIMGEESLHREEHREEKGIKCPKIHHGRRNTGKKRGSNE